MKNKESQAEALATAHPNGVADTVVQPNPTSDGLVAVKAEMANSFDALPILSPSEFTREISRGLQKSAPHLPNEVIKDLEIRMHLSTEYSGNIFLRAAYQEYVLNPGSQVEVLARWISKYLEAANTTPNTPIDVSRVLPILKPRSWLEKELRATAIGANEPNQYFHQDFIDDVIIAYAVDAANTMRYLMNRDLDILGLSAEKLQGTALANLRTLLPAPKIIGERGVYQIICGGNYDLSLIFMDEYWEAPDFRIRGEIVIAVPARDYLLVTGTDCPEGIQRVSMLAEDAISKSPYKVSAKLLVRRNRKFVPYLPTPSE